MLSFLSDGFGRFSYYGPLTDTNTPMRITNLSTNGFVKSKSSNGTVAVDSNNYEPILSISPPMYRCGNTLFMNAADANTDGYIKKADWASFTAINNYSFTAPISKSGTTISMHVADATHNGYMSSSDWSACRASQWWTYWSIDPNATSLQADSQYARIGRAGTTMSATTTPLILGADNILDMYGTIADGYGPKILFETITGMLVENKMGEISCVRKGANTTGKLQLSVYNAGTRTEVLNIVAGSASISGDCNATAYRVSGTAGIDNSAAGTPATMTVSKGIVTAMTKVTPASNGTYNIDGAAAGTVSSITITNGIITGITTR